MSKAKYYVRMTDSFMSGWGMSAGKTNVLVIECDTLEQAELVEYAGRQRPEMKRVQICADKPRERRGVLLSIKTFDQLGQCWKEGR